MGYSFWDQKSKDEVFGLEIGWPRVTLSERLSAIYLFIKHEVRTKSTRNIK